MNDCSKHKKDILGISDMHKLAEMVGDLHYQSLSEFILNLAAKIADDAEKDRYKGRVKLARELEACSDKLYDAEQKILNAWTVCGPFMKYTSNETT